MRTRHPLDKHIEGRRLTEQRKYAHVERVRRVVERRRMHSEALHRMYGCPIDRFEKWLLAKLKETP